MIGHETLTMIYEWYYSYTKNYQRDDGKPYMENLIVMRRISPPMRQMKWLLMWRGI